MYFFVSTKQHDGRWLGKSEKTKAVGWFPPGFVVPLDEKTTPAPNGKSTNNGNLHSNLNIKS